MNDWAERVARSWVHLYTRNLPATASERRQEEIRSDLFEHAAFAGRSTAQQFHVLGRVLWGIPADLSWRRAARASRERRLVEGDHMTLKLTTTLVVGFVALFNVWAAVGVWVGAGAEDGSDAGGPRYGIPMLFAAALLVYGLVCRDRFPRRSTILIAVGAAIPMVLLYWMAPLVVPFWLLVSGLVIYSEPGRRSTVDVAT